MLEINLLPVREARRKAGVRQQLMQLVFGLLITFGVIAIVHSRISDQIGTAETHVEQMEGDIAKFKPQLDQVASFKKRKAELLRKIDVIDNLDRARSGPVRVLTELSDRIPDRLWLTSLETKGNTVLLKGLSLDNELVALFLRALGESPAFGEIDLGGTKLGSSKSGLKLVNFNISAQLLDRSAAETASKKKKGKKRGHAKG